MLLVIRKKAPADFKFLTQSLLWGEGGFRFLKAYHRGRLILAEWDLFLFSLLMSRRKNAGSESEAVGLSPGSATYRPCGHLTSVNLNFLICKMGVLTLQTGLDPTAKARAQGSRGVKEALVTGDDFCGGKPLISAGGAAHSTRSGLRFLETRKRGGISPSVGLAEAIRR